MVGVRERISRELESLIEEGSQLLESLRTKKATDFDKGYQTWYTRALAVVKQLIPERLDEFTRLYHDKDVIYTIARYLRRGYSSYDTQDALVGARNRFLQQCLILQSAQTRLDDILTNIHGLVQAEIVDSELDAATELWKAGHIRPAGTLAGVVLERHLAKVCSSKNLASRKKKPTLVDWNDLLKEANVYDIPTWRGIQRLVDIRNLCAHLGDREPTKEEVDELIRGAERITKTIL
jgi:hypothetical protein